MTMQRRTPKLGLFGLAVLGTLAGCSTGNGAQTSSEPPAAQPTTPTASETASGAPEVSTEYENGTYTATGHYTSPAGAEEISVTLSLDDGVITAVEVEPHATAANSVVNQRAFASGISQVVVGKAIDDVKVSKVSGSSLTSTGFNEALDEIKQKAAK